jgi:hypothetical protein
MSAGVTPTYRNIRAVSRRADPFHAALQRRRIRSPCAKSFVHFETFGLIFLFNTWSFFAFFLPELCQAVRDSLQAKANALQADWYPYF